MIPEREATPEDICTGDGFQRYFNGYGEWVAHLYQRA